MKADGHTPTPWRTFNSHKPGFREVVRLDCADPNERKWLFEIGPSDTAYADTEFIVEACNSHDALIAERAALRQLLQESLDGWRCRIVKTLVRPDCECWPCQMAAKVKAAIALVEI